MRQYLLVLIFIWFGLGLSLSGQNRYTISGNISDRGRGESLLGATIYVKSLNTGTVKYNISLTVPPGTNGHAPSLSLNYNSGNGNSPIGYGWKISETYIQRQTEKGIPRYVDRPNFVDDDSDGETDEIDEMDRFINDMKEELIRRTTLVV